MSIDWKSNYHATKRSIRNLARYMPCSGRIKTGNTASRHNKAFRMGKLHTTCCILESRFFMWCTTTRKELTCFIIEPLPRCHSVALQKYDRMQETVRPCIAWPPKDNSARRPLELEIDKCCIMLHILCLSEASSNNEAGLNVIEDPIQPCNALNPSRCHHL